MIKTLRLVLIVALGAAACFAMSQTWANAYEAGLKASRALKWEDARQSFMQAAAIRPEDASTPTVLPGPISERRLWRNGAPYSPNFLAAYAEFRNAATVKDRDAQTAMVHTVAEELQTLIDKGQVSPPTLYYLNAAYANLGETDKARALLAKYGKPGVKLDWKVDTEVVDPGELAQIDAMMAAMQPPPEVVAQQPPKQPAQTPKKGQAAQPPAGEQPKQVPAGRRQGVGPETPALTGAGAALLGPVPQDPNKFALLIGNTEGKIPDELVPFSADDAQKLRQGLELNAGYIDKNVDLVLNATADQILASAKALADRVPDGGSVFLFFSGTGVNIDGQDYLAGVDADNPISNTGMVLKTEVYKQFMAKGAKIFAFYQANRTIRDGRFFGMEIPLVGSIAQSQATMQGERVNSIVRNGRTVGIYIDAFNNVLGELRSNRVPINEFGWQVFYRIRRGDTGTTGGGSRQTPTLPVLTNMAADARF